MRFISLFAAVLGCLCLSSNAWAQGASVYLEDLTWPEIKERMQKGSYAVIIPTGGTEQNGPHLAVGKHNRIVNYTSGEIAQKLGFALVAPVLAYVPEGRISPPEGHMLFPGTVSLREETFAAVLEDAARSFREEGFKLICFIGDHGGNQRMQQYVADKLNAEWRSQGIQVINVSDYYANNGQKEWVQQVKLAIPTPDAHAGFFDTSELMAIDERLVRRGQVGAYSDKDFLINGAKGDATSATVNYGRSLLSLKINAAVAQIQHASQVRN